MGPPSLADDSPIQAIPSAGWEVFHQDSPVGPDARGGLKASSPLRRKSKGWCKIRPERAPPVSAPIMLMGGEPMPAKSKKSKKKTTKKAAKKKPAKRAAKKRTSKKAAPKKAAPKPAASSMAMTPRPALGGPPAMPMGGMPPAPMGAPKRTKAEHTVAVGDSLRLIALKYYGPGGQENWKVIYDANKAVIGENPYILKPGQVLKIPEL